MPARAPEDPLAVRPAWPLPVDGLKYLHPKFSHLVWTASGPDSFPSEKASGTRDGLSASPWRHCLLRQPHGFEGVFGVEVGSNPNSPFRS